MKPETATTQPGNMRPTHFVATNAACAVCGKPFLKRRAWAQFCGDPCRKAFHKNLHATGIDASIRKDISAIKAGINYLIEIQAGGTK